MFKLEQGEKVILKVRRHKLGLIFESLFLVLFVVLPPILFWAGGRAISIRGNDLSLFAGVYALILLIAWMIFFVIWTNYYLDVMIVTNLRIIDVDQKGFFSREIATLGIDKIQDITVNISGVLATFLDFGTLKIQTAAEVSEFIIRDIPKPNEVKSIIYNLHNQH